MNEILGLSYGSHDTSACVVAGGAVRCAAEEERFNREKRTVRFPSNAIQYCLEELGLPLGAVEAVVLPQRPELLVKKSVLAPLRTRRFEPGAISHDMGLVLDLLTIRRRLRHHTSGRSDRLPKVQFVKHHDAHAASAFLLSPFETSAVLTVDGIGECETASMYLGSGTKIHTLRKYEFPFSVGKFYGAICRHLGFNGPSKEGVVMGLSALGNASRYEDRLKELIRFNPESGAADIDLSYFRVGWHPGRPSRVSERFIGEFGAERKPGETVLQRHMDMAAAAQIALEHVILSMLRYLSSLVTEKRLCMAGGVALNSVLNGKLLEQSGFSELFIQPAANDGGLALGSALYRYNCTLSQPRVEPMPHAYLGPEYTDSDYATALSSAGLEFRKSDNIARDTAARLADGKVVGWFQGKMEIGPRALGSRSILADPRESKMRDQLNKKVKHREWFRPFAPVVIWEHASRYFDIVTESPYMLRVCKVKREWRSRLAAVTHADGTARVQTIRRIQHPVYHDVISEFAALTDVPVLLNTSFNDRGEPIVCSPTDAVDCFVRTGMDTLAMGPFIADKMQ